MRRDARIAAQAMREGRGDADALVAVLEAVWTKDVDGVVVGVGPGVDPGLARITALAAGVPADVPVQVVAGADAGHVALHTGALAMLSGYQECVLVAALAERSGAWPPGGRTEALDWRLSFPDAAERAGNRLQEHPVDAQAWFSRHGGPAEGDLLAGAEGDAGAVGLRLSADADGARIASLAGGGADPAVAGRAVERAAHRALHHVQIGIEEVDAALVAQDLPADRAATATALGLSFDRVLDPPALAPAVRTLAGLSALLADLEARDSRHGLLLSGGPDGLGRATLLDTAHFE